MARPQWKLGHIRWFDPSSGKGTVRSDDGDTYWVYLSAIDDFCEAKNLKENARVQFTLLDDPDFKLVERLQEITG